MFEWWGSLVGIERILGGIGVFTVVVFILQLIVLVVGGHDSDHDSGFEHSNGSDSHEHGGDTDQDNSLLHYFTIRNLNVFFLGLSWGGLMFLDMGWSTPASVLMASGIGIVLTAVNLLILRLLANLESNGNVPIEKATGSKASVLIRIPKDKRDYGKVSLSLDGRVVEIEAHTEDGVMIPVGAIVEVVRVEGGKVIVR